MDRRDTMAAGAGRARPSPTARHATWLRARSGDMVAMSVPHVRATMESRRRHLLERARAEFCGREAEAFPADEPRESKDR